MSSRAQPLAPGRVALIATGGLYHWVGTPETGRINPDWDHWVLDHVARGDGGTAGPPHLGRDRARRRQRRAGDPELDRAAGRRPRVEGDVLAYEPVAEWITGCATVWAHRVIAISYALNKLLTGIARQHQMKESLTEEDMAGHALSDAERTALRAGDIGKLYELGANPYLIRRVFRRRFTI